MQEEITIGEVLHNIQVALSVPKARYNSFGKYNYRNAEDIVDAVKKLLPKGFTLLLSDEIIMLGNRYYVRATATLQSSVRTVTLGNGIRIESEKAEGWARESDEKKGMDASQITGAASSYARKYALNGLFAIDDGVDADSQNNNQPANISRNITPEQRLETAKKKAAVIIAEYKTCKDLVALASIQERYHSELKRFSEAYEEIFNEVNTVGLQVIASFDQ